MTFNSKILPVLEFNKERMTFNSKILPVFIYFILQWTITFNSIYILLVKMIGRSN